MWSNKYMKKILCLILIIFVCFILTSCGKKEVESRYDKIIKRDYLIAGVKTDSIPFGFINNETQQPDGFDIDVVKYIAQDILGSDRKIEFVSVTPENRIEKLTSGEVDIIAATMSATPQRQYLIDVSEPYFIAGQTALVKQDSDVYTFADLKTKTIIVILGTTAEKNIRRIIPMAKIIGYTNYTEAFDAFLNGKGDAISTDNTILSGFLSEHPEYRMLKNKISKEPYVIGIRQPDENEDDKLKRNIDIIIIRMHKDGTLRQLKEKWNLK